MQAATNRVRSYVDDPFLDLVTVDNVSVHWRAVVTLGYNHGVRVKGDINAKDWLELAAYENVDCPVVPYVRDNPDSAVIYAK